MRKMKVAIFGSGNVRTDLVIEMLRLPDVQEIGAMVGLADIDIALDLLAARQPAAS